MLRSKKPDVTAVTPFFWRLWFRGDAVSGGLHCAPADAVIRNRAFLVVRVREGAPQSPCALVSARPRPKAAARDRSDTVARRRAPLPWRACDGTRQVTCAYLRVVHRSWCA